ncbi:sporulation protein YqfD [Effusibacillus pohliae]|uniref:sporulation protein YqfD n=1 Tax=Effusibacillus pohliae TaxID=232270 RepID=UPI00037DECBD|nr:sporulation protein YqfD [Effusibacillus pohliae]
MLNRILLDYYKGYVIVTVSGKQLATLVNLASREGIWIRDILYGANGSLQMTILRTDVRRLRPLLRQTGCKIHFGKRTGFPFLLQRARRRKSFVAGCLVFVALLYTLTSVIWSVEVEGAKKLSPETILAAAEATGIRKGAWIGRLPAADVLQAEILDKVPELSWVGVSIHGTKVRIQVMEKVSPPDPQPSKPQHIVAAKPGVIEKILPEKGIAQVRPGQTVKPGEILISGSLEDGKTFVHAKGTVEARVWERTEMRVPLELVRQVYTGHSFKKNFVMFGSFPVQVWGYGHTPYRRFEEQAIDREFHVGSFTLPIRFREVTVKEAQEETISLSKEQAEAEAKHRAAEDVMAKIGGKGRIDRQIILHSRIEHGNLYTTVLSEVIEDIGKPQPF